MRQPRGAVGVKILPELLRENVRRRGPGTDTLQGAAMAERSSTPAPAGEVPADPLEAVLAAAFGAEPAAARPVGEAAAQGTLGDFRILRELGRGGCGNRRACPAPPL